MNQEILQAYLRQEETPAYIFDLDMLKSRVRSRCSISCAETSELDKGTKKTPPFQQISPYYNKNE